MISPVTYFSIRELEISRNSLQNIAYLICIEEKKVFSLSKDILDKVIEKIDLIIAQKEFFNLWGIQECDIELEPQDVKIIIDTLNFNQENLTKEQIKGYLQAELEEIEKVKKKSY